jgi:hypothetical protein
MAAAGAAAAVPGNVAGYRSAYTLHQRHRAISRLDNMYASQLESLLDELRAYISISDAA